MDVSKLLFKLYLTSFFILFNSTLWAQGVKWNDWSENLFVQARTNKKLILLNLEANWCHWCHVMQQETYSNPSVQRALAADFISVKVDQDMRPDLSNRYRQYGWPATIIFDGDAREIVKLSGYISAEEFEKTLKKALTIKQGAIVDESQKAAAQDMGLEHVLNELERRYFASFDANGGLKTKHKFLDSSTIEYATWQVSKLDSSNQLYHKHREILTTTLNANLKLIDPVWGGVYQYSSQQDWNHPHFEKLLTSQAKNLKLYADAYLLTQEKTYLRAANDIYHYAQEFLRDAEGVFYASQDADVIQGQRADAYFALGDEARRKIGVPRIDRNIYTGTNARMLSSILAFYRATLDPDLLAVARKGADWLQANRALNGAGYRHAQLDKAGPYLEDNLYMGILWLDLYQATSELSYLMAAKSSADFILQNFVKTSIQGILSAHSNPSSVLTPQPVLEENLNAARFLNLLYNYLGQDIYKQNADTALKFCSAANRAFESISEPGIIIAVAELAVPALHLTVVGSKDDPLAKELYKAAFQYFSNYKRLDWYDRKGQALPNSDLEYPNLPKAALFVCSEKRCSLPIFKAELLKDTVRNLIK